MQNCNAHNSDHTSRSFLLISGHDFRSKRKANIHFIARELAKRGPTRFFSIGFSALSIITGDPRASLWSRANGIERYQNVDCYLWRSLLHPVNLRHSWLAWLERAGFDIYRHLFPQALMQWIREATVVGIESGLPLIAFDLVKRLNPGARVVYLCSDSLDTIGCSAYLKEELQHAAKAFDVIRIPSPLLAPDFPPGSRLRVIAQGMDEMPARNERPSPFAGGINVVSIGSMLFDRSFFESAAPAFPELTFHIIGGGKNASGLSAPNIRLYGEMPFEETVAFIEYADVGIAPYDGDKVSAYLVDTSMKLLQYEAYGLPAVCPIAVAGDRYGRFGYLPGNGTSIQQAMQAARSLGRFSSRPPPSWSEVTDRILSP
ncbi:MAG: hypothetical protein ABJD53_04470 [Gammaproteobacteria bacterium]